jgi:hypothetical protein
MNNHYNALYDIAVSRHQQDIEIAQQHRLAKIAAHDELVRNQQEQTMNMVRTPRRRHLLFSLGVSLSNWGCRLQSRYGQVPCP